ncbi:MAG: pyridoxamine 5'-phosphate oxidase family protein [Chloroflexi bacterium]|nr:pyridoxamine 5'-phosphate oxidase family protein [Chloroflexota bacterium]
MSDALRERALAYLRQHNVMTLATAGPQGVWAAAVFYVNHDFTLYFLSAPTSRHSLNIAANPAVAATVQEDYRDWPEIKGIQLEGAAVRVEGTEKAAAVARYWLKFPIVGDPAQAPAEIARALSRIAWYRVTPARLYLIDNSHGFGHRDEVLPGEPAAAR